MDGANPRAKECIAWDPGEGRMVSGVAGGRHTFIEIAVKEMPRARSGRPRAAEVVAFWDGTRQMEEKEECGARRPCPWQRTAAGWNADAEGTHRAMRGAILV